MCPKREEKMGKTRIKSFIEKQQNHKTRVDNKINSFNKRLDHQYAFKPVITEQSRKIVAGLRKQKSRSKTAEFSRSKSVTVLPRREVLNKISEEEEYAPPKEPVRKR